jgi:plastocyanin
LRIPTLVAAAALAAALVGSPGPSGAGPVQEIAIHTFQFQPPRLEVSTGSTVRWTNDDDIEHIVTSGTPEQRSWMFRTSLNGKGKAMNVTFTKAGNYSYFCDRHQSMRGEIVVK